MQGELQDKCGIVGIYSYEDSVDVASWIYSALYTLQHRGQESAGISVLKEGRINTHVGMGLVSDVFDKDLIDILNGNVGIGHVRYSTTGESLVENCQPFVEHEDDIIIAFAHNGDFVNSRLLREELLNSGYEFRSTTDSEVICHLIIDEYNKTKDAISAIQNTCEKLIGSYSFVTVINGILYAVRDPLGMKPLSIGRSENMVVLASETVAFDSLDIEYERSIEPGEILEELETRALEVIVVFLVDVIGGRLHILDRLQQVFAFICKMNNILFAVAHQELDPLAGDFFVQLLLLGF